MILLHPCGRKTYTLELKKQLHFTVLIPWTYFGIKSFFWRDFSITQRYKFECTPPFLFCRQNALMSTNVRWNTWQVMYFFNNICLWESATWIHWVWQCTCLYVLWKNYRIRFHGTWRLCRIPRGECWMVTMEQLVSDDLLQEVRDIQIWPD